jgi:hypothetical protein
MRGGVNSILPHTFGQPSFKIEIVAKLLLYTGVVDHFIMPLHGTAIIDE